MTFDSSKNSLRLFILVPQCSFGSQWAATNASQHRTNFPICVFSFIESLRSYCFISHSIELNSKRSSKANANKQKRSSTQKEKKENSCCCFRNIVGIEISCVWNNEPTTRSKSDDIVSTLGTRSKFDGRASKWTIGLARLKTYDFFEYPKEGYQKLIAEFVKIPNEHFNCSFYLIKNSKSIVKKNR